MKLLTTQAIREWDEFTIRQEPIASIDLMERAGRACKDFILTHFSKDHEFLIFCGQGNNGGDGLVIARLLLVAGFRVSVAIVQHSKHPSADFETNLSRLKRVPEASVQELRSEGDAEKRLAEFTTPQGVLIDALLGTGTNKPLQGLLADAARAINRSAKHVISIDVPTGLPADIEQWDPETYHPVISAHLTLTFQIPKSSFLFPTSGKFCGTVHILDIGLHPGYIANQVPNREYVDQTYAEALVIPREKFDHKGRFGHALLVAGSRGKNGAAILAARACLRSGVGLLSVGVPQQSCVILQSAVPEAMVVADNSDHHPVFSLVTEKYTAIGVGPGIGTETNTLAGYRRFLETAQKPLVIDADGINLLATLLKTVPGFRIPPNAILTPHLKEFERLAGKATSDYQRFRMLQEFAQKHHIYIVLKGAHSCLATPEGTCYFNSTGNPALAKGGSGDVLTGMITGLLAQQYSPRDAALLGMYYHGKAADDVRRRRVETAIIASDIIEAIRIGKSSNPGFGRAV